MSRLLITSCRPAHLAKLQLALVMCAMVLSAGCSTSTDAATTKEVATLDGESFTVSITDGRPHEVVTNDGRRIPFSAGEAIVDDHLLLANSDGTIETHRTPQAIMAEVDRLPTPYLEDDTFELVILDGDQGSHTTDPKTGRELLRAITCENPACPGEPNDEHPFLFNAIGDSRASRDHPNAEVEARRLALPALGCPACGQSKHVVEYQLPDSSRRKSELLAELAHARAARDRTAR